MADCLCRGSRPLPIGKPGSTVLLKNDYRVRLACTTTNSTIELILKDQKRSPRIPAADGSMQQYVASQSVDYQVGSWQWLVLSG